MSIKVWDYLEEYTEERTEILEAVDRVFKSGTLVLGSSVANFEKEFSQYCESTYGIGVDNATNGIFLSLKALGIENGDEVVTVSNTAVPTVSAIVQAGATPRFVDVCATTGLMNVALLEEAITSRTKCIIPVHLYGQCVDMDPLISLARSKNIHVLEDCSQAHGAKYHGRRAGSIGDLGVFSFYPTKPLGGYGDGGLITTSNPALDAKLRSLRFYGMKGVYYAEEAGYNSRLDEVHAEILRGKLKRLDSYIARRRTLSNRYHSLLAQSSLSLPRELDGNSHVFYVYVVQHSSRDHIVAELKKNEIFVNISYPWPIHTMRGYASLGYKEGDLPVTEMLAKRIFSLPMYPNLTFAQQDRVCEVLLKIVENC